MIQPAFAKDPKSLVRKGSFGHIPISARERRLARAIPPRSSLHAGSRPEIAGEARLLRPVRGIVSASSQALPADDPMSSLHSWLVRVVTRVGILQTALADGPPYSQIRRLVQRDVQKQVRSMNTPAPVGRKLPKNAAFHPRCPGYAVCRSRSAMPTGARRDASSSTPRARRVHQAGLH
jgi:hypothetical protein